MSFECDNVSDETSFGNAPTNDTFPEVAFFEVPNDASKTANSKNKELVKHPAFRQISAINGEINRMSVKHLKIELERLSFDGRGCKDVLRKRLKAYERSRILSEACIEDPNMGHQHYTHIVVIDFEATCEEHQTKDYIHEIIEFPAVLIRVSDAARVGEFHSLVRPVLNPTLSDFCRQLTGIEQSDVDAAPTFPEVLNSFESWLTQQGVGAMPTRDFRHGGHGSSGSSESGDVAAPRAQTSPTRIEALHSEALGKFSVVTDGPWDMARFLLMQCSVSELPFPSWARSWINLRKVFSNFYITKRLCLSEMLTALGIEFVGRPHCGLDDARNIAAIAEVLLRDGASPRVNETIAHLPHSMPPSFKGSSVANVTLKDFKSSQRRRNRSSCPSSSDVPEDASPGLQNSDGDAIMDALSADGPDCGGVDVLCDDISDLAVRTDASSHALTNGTSHCVQMDAGRQLPNDIQDLPHYGSSGRQGSGELTQPGAFPRYASADSSTIAMINDQSGCNQFPVLESISSDPSCLQDTLSEEMHFDAQVMTSVAASELLLERPQPQCNNPCEPMRGSSSVPKKKYYANDLGSYVEMSDHRYIHYSQINNRNKFVAKKFPNNVNPHSAIAESSYVECEAGKQTSGQPAVSSNSSRRGRRVNTHKPPTSQAVGVEARQPGKRQPYSRRGGGIKTSFHGAHKNVTALDDCKTYKNVDFNDSSQFPELGPLKRSYK